MNLMVKCSSPVENTEFQWCAAPTPSHITHWYLQPCERRGVTGNCLQSKRDETEAA